MKELKCPKCGTTFTVDEADYATIVKQVRDAEFAEEVSHRLMEQKALSDAQQQLAKAEADKEHQTKLSEMANVINSLNVTITELQTKLASIEKNKDAEKTSELAQKNQEISDLTSKLKQKDQETTIKVMEAENKLKDEINEKEKEIATLKSTIQQEKLQATQKEQALTEVHRTEIKLLQDELASVKDFKSKMSTKMVGEDLEQHCYEMYEQYLRPFFPETYFEKDNDIVSGTKGDFVLIDRVDGFKQSSFMFEMKNESDTDGKKHKNEDFLKKLDADRNKKGCKYAILVSTLEPDSDLYNQGIVSKSHLFPNMYVIRPQFFVPFVVFLINAERESLKVKKELEEIKKREVDVTNFQEAFDKGKDLFFKHCRFAKDNHDSAIKQIDAAITNLQKVRDSLMLSNKQLDQAGNNLLEDLSLKTLTKDNPVMQQKFAEAAASKKTEIISEERALDNPE